MDAEWIKSPTARRVLVLWADPRPAWLWSGDGATLLWRNAAARLFNAKIKKHGLKLSADAVPIKGQVSRLIRLGRLGQASLSRVQLLAGEKPLATTCSCTPLTIGESAALLLVAMEPIDRERRDAATGLGTDSLAEALFPAGADYVLVTEGGAATGSGRAVARHAAEGAAGAVELRAGPVGEMLLVYPPGDADFVRIAREAQDLADVAEPMLPMGLPEAPESAPVPPVATDDWVEPMPAAPGDRALSSLFDRLADDAGLYTTLTDADEVFVGKPSEAPAVTLSPEPDMIAAVIEYSDDPEGSAPVPPLAADEPHTHWMITGRGFRVLGPKTPPDDIVPELEAAQPQLPPVEEPMEAASIDAVADAETAERVSRYNFVELGRILTDRVANEPRTATPAPVPARPESVVSLNAETLVLNRLPLAILVFRDQQVLFANRALTDLLGHDSVESLRAAGIGSIFPGEEGVAAGAVSRLVRRDGIALPVMARLQSVSWQGRAALMLSASPAEPIRGHEGAVRAFAEIAAEAREEGFLVADRAGVVRQVSGHGLVLLGKTESEVTGRPLAVLVGKPDMEPLRAFLERPARFAETARPSLVVATEDGDVAITLFAEGQAGVVTGYFAFLGKRRRIAPPVADAVQEADPSVLSRLSRGLRRPLNTIIGFADMIRSAALDPAGTDRSAEYARDIRTAGLEIAVLVDELDDFTRLREGRYEPRPSDVDLSALLESSMVRVKAQAGAARVLVRSAISEQLPRIHADRASLGQALLNLLASAIDQTPIGGSVILSAQTDDEGGIAIHVRDGAQGEIDLGERFVVFRDGTDRDGAQLAPVRSTVGLALTRSLLAVNACSLSVDPVAGSGTLFSLLIPAGLVRI